MKLNDYLEKTKQTKTDFAGVIGITTGMVSHIATGRKIPSLDLALKIQDATEGAVTVRDLLPTNHPALRLLGEKEVAA